MATKRAEQAERTRRRILETTHELIVRQGFDATSLQQIADTMGVTKANVYYYFKTKADLLVALNEASQQRMAAVFDQAELIEDRAERREFLIDSYTRALVAGRTISAVNQADPGIRRNPIISAAIETLGRRGLELFFGPEPTLDEQLGYYLISDVGALLQRFPDLPDDELQVALKDLCFRLIP